MKTEARAGINAGELEKVCGSVMARSEVIIISEVGKSYTASYADVSEIGDTVFIYID